MKKIMKTKNWNPGLWQAITSDHLILTNSGWVPAKDLMNQNIIVVSKENIVKIKNNRIFSDIDPYGEENWDK